MTGKRQGHFCKICQRYRANEKFGGRGHAQHICKDCQRALKATRRQKNGERQQNPLSREQPEVEQPGASTPE
jgi:hypothetical protein